MKSIFRTGALLAAALLTQTACAPLQTLTAATEPTDLYDLTPKSTFASDLPQVRRQIVVDEPTAVNYVNTDRIPVKNGPFKVEYFPVARWVDRAPRLVQTLMVESIENTGVVSAVGQEAIGLTSDFTLVTDLREFQAIATPDERGGSSDTPVEVHVQLNIKIIREPEGLIVGSESFGQRVRASSNEMQDVVAAFDEALGKAMRGAVEWTIRSVAVIPSNPGY